MILFLVYYYKSIQHIPEANNNMANIVDYIKWRGDLPLSVSPFNEVDNLIFSEFCYMDFENIVPPTPGSGISIHDAAEKLKEKYSNDDEYALFDLTEIYNMILLMKDSARYSSMKLSGYVNEIDNEKARQFSAITIETGDKHIYIAYRGTDDTLAGWREDLEFACTPDVPAQKRALQYFKDTIKMFPFKKTRLGGHSKGGNLAVYSALYCPSKLKKKITDVWSNDGPGFFENIHKLKQYTEIKDKLHTIVPKSSVVGMLLEHDDNYTVVDSDELGLMQHNGLTWQVIGTGFITLPHIQESARKSSLTIREWMLSISPEKRKEFADALYNILTASGAKTFTDLKEENLKGYFTIAKATFDADKEIRNGLIQFIQLLLTVNAKLILGGIQKDSPDKRK